MTHFRFDEGRRATRFISVSVGCPSVAVAVDPDIPYPTVRAMESRLAHAIVTRWQLEVV